MIKQDEASGIVKILIIEASKLATDEVHITCWEHDSAIKALEHYHERKKWNEDTAELYSSTTSFTFRKVILYFYSKMVSTYTLDKEELIALAKEEKDKSETITK